MLNGKDYNFNICKNMYQAHVSILYSLIVIAPLLVGITEVQLYIYFILGGNFPPINAFSQALLCQFLLLAITEL